MSSTLETTPDGGGSGKQETGDEDECDFCQCDDTIPYCLAIGIVLGLLLCGGLGCLSYQFVNYRASRKDAEHMTPRELDTITDGNNPTATGGADSIR